MKDRRRDERRWKDEENTKKDRWMKERKKEASVSEERNGSRSGVVMKGKVQDEIIGMIIVGSHMEG